MADKVLIPIYLPRWLHQAIRKAKRAFIPASPVVVDIQGERNVEWSFLSAEMPDGPGEAIEFGCEQGYMSLVAAQRGFRVIASDLEEQTFTWQHPKVEFRAGDFLTVPLPDTYFDLAINCSSVEHVGLAGRYGIRVDQNDGDIEVMSRLAQILKPEGRLLMTAPCGRDAVLAPWCRVYGPQRLPRLFQYFTVDRQEFWIKNDKNQWVPSSRQVALDFEPRPDPSNPHGCSYALGCFVLRKCLGGAVSTERGR
jgi:SAM-dependent methyltransferase